MTPCCRSPGLVFLCTLKCQDSPRVATTTLWAFQILLPIPDDFTFPTSSRDGQEDHFLPHTAYFFHGNHLLTFRGQLIVGDVFTEKGTDAWRFIPFLREGTG